MPDHDNPLYTVLLYYSHDFMGLTFIMWASISMVILLHRLKNKCSTFTTKPAPSLDKAVRPGPHAPS